jgi:hypothetical protein
MIMTAYVPLPAVPTDRSISATLPADILDPIARAAGSIARLELADRFKVLDAFVRPGSDDAVFVRVFVNLLTALLEQLGERMVCLDSAMLYRVTAHREWRDAAKRFLSDVDTIEWMEANPAAGAFITKAMSLPDIADV